MSQNLFREKEAFLDQYIANSLTEDIGAGDHTSLACINPKARAKARLIIKDVGVVAGIEVAERFFRKVEPSATFNVLIKDGQAVHFGDVAFEVECNAQTLLQLERSVLNTMQRMSGIATMSNRFLFEIEDLNVQILDTRKTTPTLRFLEKWAVRLGGCTNYRWGLDDWIMIKDNHIDACGGIREAIEQVARYQKDNGLNLNVTVEVRNLVELYKVLEVGNITRIMLDNFELPLLGEAIAIIGGQFETEASGGVNIHTVRNIAKTGVNYISVGALTHSATSLDMSLKVVKKQLA